MALIFLEMPFNYPNIPISLKAKSSDKTLIFVICRDRISLKTIMNYTSETAAERFLNSLVSYYNIIKAENLEEKCLALEAVCEFYEHSEKFMITKKANLWTAEAEEFLYLFKCDCLSVDTYNNAMDYVNKDWQKRAHIGPGHMYTYVTPVFICNTAEEAAVKMLKKCHVYKSYKFSIHGWMEYHTAIFQTEKNAIVSNFSGFGVKKTMEKVFFGEKKTGLKKLFAKLK